jgi:hypothetical protein
MTTFFHDAFCLFNAAVLGVLVLSRSGVMTVIDAGRIAKNEIISLSEFAVSEDPWTLSISRSNCAVFS